MVIKVLKTTLLEKTNLEKFFKFDHVSFLFRAYKFLKNWNPVNMNVMFGKNFLVHDYLSKKFKYFFYDTHRKWRNIISGQATFLKQRVNISSASLAVVYPTCFKPHKIYTNVFSISSECNHGLETLCLLSLDIKVMSKFDCFGGNNRTKFYYECVVAVLRHARYTDSLAPWCYHL